MISLGCNLQTSRPYEHEVEFARPNGFRFFQIGYTAGGFQMHPRDEPHLETLVREAFPVIVHALLRVSEFEQHLPRLLDASTVLHCRDLVIHPISQTREPGSTTLSELIEGMSSVLSLLRPTGISLYLENNGGVDPLFSSVDDVEAVFAEHPDLRFLLDIAHVKDYKTLCRMAEVRMPDILHVADRRSGSVHEHLPLGQGDIDFARVLSGPLAGFRGAVVFEVPSTDEDRTAARDSWHAWQHSW